ncbi:hypothetical protein ACS0TY_034448 [Phlomoides rotata]
MRKLLSGTDIVANPHINSKIRVWKKEYSALSDLLSKSGIGWNSTTNTIDVLDETVWDAQKKPYYESWLDIFGKDRATREHAADPIDIVNELMRNETEEEGEIGMKIDAEMKDNGQVAGDASVCKPSGSGLNTIKGKKRKGLPSKMALLVDTLGEFMKSTADSFNSLANRMVPELEVKVARTPLNDLMKCIPGLSLQDKLKLTMMTQMEKKMAPLPEKKSQNLSACPNILRLHDVYEDDDYIHLITDLCDGGDLFDRITSGARFSESDTTAVLKQLMVVIAFCHRLGVTHRDIKPDKILFDSRGKLKLADFGSAEMFEISKMNDVVGTLYYVAPEVLMGRSYNEKVDVWSAGVIL